MRRNRETGQAIVMVIVALGILLLGALGLAIDGGSLYAQRQMAQAAADASAQAAVLSIFNGNNIGSNAFGSAAYTCSTTNATTPCVYARKNGFGATAIDTVYVDSPSAASIGLDPASLSGVDPVNILRVTITRNVNTGLMKMLGIANGTIRASASAAILDMVSPLPIIVTHPTLTGSFSSNGGPTLTICGGPRRSVQVNSNNTVAGALAMNSNTTIDLSRAGPDDPGNCTTGTGTVFGTYGTPSAPPFTFLAGTKGKYVQPSSPILDPLRDINPPNPTTLGLPTNPAKQSLANGVSGCPPSPSKPCMLYSPGVYTAGINVKNETGVFKPGIYYMQNGGFGNDANGEMVMATGFASDPDTGQGMLVYNTGDGVFTVGANSAASLLGAPDTSYYKGILFFQDRSSPAHTNVGGNKGHKFGGGGAMTLTGTIYVTNTKAIMDATAGHYQNVLLQGTPGSATNIIGQIIVGTLTIAGNAGIRMQLNPNSVLHIRQIALVK